MALTKIKTGGLADNSVTDAKVADNITAGTAATLATARNINGVSFNGSSAITVTAAAGTLTGNTLASGVTASSLTSVGTLSLLTTSGSTGSNYIGSFTNTSGTGWGLFVKGGADNADYTLRVQDKDAADLLSVKAGGRTGFGTNDPASILHVKTSANSSENIRIQNDDSMTTMGVSSDGYSFHTYQHSLYLASWDGSTWSTKARWDSNGNLGIGHLSPQFGLTLAQGDTDATAIGWEDASNNKRASIYCGTSDDSLRFHVANADRMKITTDGELILKGTSLANDFGDERGQLCISSTDHGSNNNYAVLQMQGHSNSNNVGIGGIYFYDHSSNNAIIQAQRQNNSGSAKLAFYTSESGGSPQQRMTIYDGGDMVLDNGTRTSPCALVVQNNGSSGWLGAWSILRSENDARRGAGVTMHNDAVGNSWFAGVRYNANFARYSVCYESTGSYTQQTADSDHEVFHITDNGATYNDQNTWGDSSDKRIKHSIVDSNSQWDDIKALKVKNFKKIKHGDDAKSLIGVIAQDLEDSGMNGLVDEHPASESQIKMYKDIKEGDSIKSVKYSILYMKAIKALQEAMERIEALENA